MIRNIPIDSTGAVRPDLIPVAAYLIVEGYCAPEYCLDRLAAGQSPAELVAIGLLEPVDLDAVTLLMNRARRPAPSESAAIFRDEPALADAYRDALRPLSGGAPIELDSIEPFDAGDDDFPRRKTAADYRAEYLAVVAPYYRDRADG